MAWVAWRCTEAKAAQVLGIGLFRPQPIGKAAAAHQREDEARRLVLQIVAEQRQQMRVAALL